MRSEVHEHDEQVARAGAAGRAPDRRASAASLLASVQSAKVYAAAIVRLPGAEGILAIGLSEAGGAVGRCAQPGGHHRSGMHSALHDFPKGGASAAPLAACRAAVG